MADTREPTVEGVDVAGMVEYLVETPVVFAVLFGSRATGSAEPSSDIDVALRFPEETDTRERFRLRNRIDAGLQRYADGFVDVSDLDSLPTPVAYNALRNGRVLVGDEETVAAYRDRVEAEYEATDDERKREHREFIERLARGDV
jgi:predicted nucleotidyltransferase